MSGAENHLTHSVADDSPPVNFCVNDDVGPREPYIPKRSKRRGGFLKHGTRWVPNPLSHLALPYWARGLSTTLHQLAAHAWSVKGPMHFGWDGLAARLNKAKSTVRIHLDRLCELGLLARLSQGGGRIMGKCGNLVGMASEYTLTVLGWRVVRDLEPWPPRDPELAPEAPADVPQNDAPICGSPQTPQPVNSDDKQVVSNMPIVGTHLERGEEPLGVLFPLPYPSPNPGKETGPAEGPPASPVDPVAAVPLDLTAAVAAPTPGWLGEPRPTVQKTARQTRQDAPESTIPTGRGWRYEALSTWLLGAGVTPDAIPGAIRAATAPGVGSPLKLALWWAEKRWPDVLAWKARRQAERLERERADVAMREKIRAKQRADDARNTQTEHPCPHGEDASGNSCRTCVAVATETRRLIQQGVFFGK